jgi:hypothetical protein
MDEGSLSLEKTTPADAGRVGRILGSGVQKKAAVAAI